MSSEMMLVENTEDVPTFCSLDDHLLLLIFVHIQSHLARARLSAVCKSWRRVLSSLCAWPTTRTNPLVLPAHHLPRFLRTLNGAPAHMSITDAQSLHGDNAWLKPFRRLRHNTDSLFISCPGPPAALFCHLRRLSHLAISVEQHRLGEYVFPVLAALSSGKRSASGTCNAATPLAGLSLKGCMNEDLAPLLLLLSDTHPCLTSLHLQHVRRGRLRVFPPAPADWPGLPSSPFAHLTHLSFDNTNPTDVAPFIRSLPSLKSLSLTGEFLLMPHDLINAIADSPIERLRLGRLTRPQDTNPPLTFRDILSPLSRSAALHTLELLPIATMVPISSEPLASIRHLRLPYLGPSHGPTLWADSILPVLLPYFPHLATLSLGGCSSPALPVAPDGHIVPADQLPNTTSLDLPLLDLNQSAWSVIFNAHPHLRSFAMVPCVTLTLPLLYSLSSPCPLLTALILPKVRVDRLLGRAICSRLPLLAHLELDLSDPCLPLPHTPGKPSAPIPTLLSGTPARDNDCITILLHILGYSLPRLHTLGSFDHPSNTSTLPPFHWFPRLRTVLVASSDADGAPPCRESDASFGRVFTPYEYATQFAASSVP